MGEFPVFPYVICPPTGPSEICKWAYLEVGLFFGFPDSNRLLLWWWSRDPNGRRWLAWWKWQWRKRRKRWSPFNWANEIAVEYSVCISFEAADASVCIRNPFSHHVSPMKMPVGIPYDSVHPKITKFRFYSCSRLGIVKLLLLYKNIVPISYLASFL